MSQWDLSFLHYFTLLNFLPLEFVLLCLKAYTWSFACLGILHILRVNTTHYSESQHKRKANLDFQVFHFSKVCRFLLESIPFLVFAKKKVLLKNKPRPFIHVLSVAAFLLQQKAQVVVTSHLVAKPKISTLWPFTEFAHPLFGIGSCNYRTWEVPQSAHALVAQES